MKKKNRGIRVFEGPDGTRWGATVKVPGASNAMIVFHHPGGKTSRMDRYAWHMWHGPEARSVTSRVSPEKVLGSLTDAELARLFTRSMPISPGRTPLTGDELVSPGPGTEPRRSSRPSR